MKKILSLTILTLGLGLASCEDYLDINQDPNSPSEENITDASIMFPAIEMNLASSYGNFLRTTGGYHAQHYAHLNGTSNYVDYSQFLMSATRSSSDYAQLTVRVLSNLQTVLDLAKANEQWGVNLAATTLRAFTYQVLVDCYGEIPYTEALDASITSPAYDDGLTIYEGILAELDEALALASRSDVMCTNFLMPDDPTAASWIQFANALKLRILMRMSDVQNVQAEVAALIAEDNFPTHDIAFADCWANESGAMSPFYAEEFSTAWGSTQTNVCANVAIINSMQILSASGEVEYTDPRLEAFFSPNGSGDYIGGISGTNYPSTASLNSWCRPVASYDMPVYLITVAETEFFLAEYYARYGSAIEAEAHYNAAITASFATAGVDGLDEYLARYPFDAAHYAECIGDQKWVALAGVNSFESWCELRRLDYPAFGTAQGSDFYTEGQDDSFDTSGYVPFTLYTPISVFNQVGANHLLERYPYPESSTASNSNAPSFPGYTTPVFWGE